MPAINFKPQFAPDVESGKKRQTIRAWRKRPFRIGEMLSLWVGQRRKGCRNLGRHRCRMALPIRIDEGLFLAGHLLYPDEEEALAQADGFRDLAAMLEWFEDEHGLPFDGQLIMW